MPSDHPWLDHYNYTWWRAEVKKFLNRHGLSLQKSKWHSVHTPGYVRVRKFRTIWFQAEQVNWLVMQPRTVEHYTELRLVVV
jgi:hypothetical protein